MKRLDGEVVENFGMRPQRIGETNVFDERDLFQNILGFFAFVEAATDDGESQRLAMPEKRAITGMSKTMLTATARVIVES